VALDSHLTTGEVAASLGVPVWQVRRAADSLGLDIPRAGQYRLIPREFLEGIRLELQRKGFLPETEGARA
jgi:hypothetical protein